jgi:hypothetical protein
MSADLTGGPTGRLTIMWHIGGYTSHRPNWPSADGNLA